VQDLVFGILRAYGLEPSPETTDADLVDLERSYLGRGGSFAVLEGAEGQIVGTVGVLPYGVPGLCELRKMYLDPSWRGRGLGRRLLDHALREADRLGFDEMVAETATVLVEAVQMYRAYGFQPCEVPAGHGLAARCDLLLKRRLGCLPG
jgi:putative acetyltransferase